MVKPSLLPMLGLVLVACGGGQPSPAELFGGRVTSVVLEVDYTASARPVVGRVPLGPTVWSVFRDNAAQLLGDGKALTVPSRLEEMQEIPEPGGGADFTTERILALAEAHRDQRSGGERASFYALWLPGYYQDPSGRRPDVLGVSLGDTGVIAMFKPVIDKTTSGAPALADGFVEQSVLVHEFGHAVGLVNRGVPLRSSHHDAEHGAHCQARECVMYYLNEGPAEVLEYAKRRLQTGQTALFGAECLADVAALRGR